MPNGEDRNWVRACAAVDGFRADFGSWPTRLRISPGVLENLRWLFSAESFKRINELVQLVPDEDAEFLAEDDEGHSYSYGSQGFPAERPSPKARDWFGVRPLHH